MTQPHTDLEVNRDELLGEIDFEIEQVSKELSRPGWTEWAIYGGFGITLWTLVTFQYRPEVSLTAVAQLFIFLMFVYQSLGMFRVVYAGSSNEFLGWLTFYRHAYSSSPRVLFAGAVINLAMMVAALVGRHGVWWLYVAGVIAWLVLFLIFSGWMFWLWFEDFPMTRTSTNPKRKGLNFLISFSISLLLTATVLWSASAYLRAALDSSTLESLLDETKIAGLLFSLAFLFEKFFYEPMPSRVRTELINLRRAFVLDGIESVQARYELKTLLGRLNPSEFVQGLCSKYRRSIDLAEFVANRILGDVVYLAAHVRDPAVPGSGEGGEVGTRFTQFVENERSLDLLAQALVDDGEEFARQVRRVELFLPIEVDEIKQVKGELSSRRASVNDLIASARASAESLRQNPKDSD